MKKTFITKADFRERRHLRLRKSVTGTPERPRMAAYVSGLHIYVQFIDDTKGVTLAAFSTLSKDLKGSKANVETAKKLGTFAAEAAKAKGITKVVFDRGGFAYAGRIKALAETARAAGLEF